MPVIGLRIINMKSVVLYFTNLFLLQQILNYSRAATKGQEFIKRLSNITTQSTLFVPDNNGLYENQVISLYVSLPLRHTLSLKYKNNTLLLSLC